MAVTNTWSDGEVLYAADLNENFTDVETDITTAVNPIGGSPILIIPRQGHTVVQGTWAWSFQNTYIYGSLLDNSATHAQNDEITFKVYLMAGTWALDVMYTKSSSFGIMTISIDGSSIGTVDAYAGSTEVNKISEITGITVATGGLKTVSIKIATKNASSSSYNCYLGALNFRRTA